MDTGVCAGVDADFFYEMYRTVRMYYNRVGDCSVRCVNETRTLKQLYIRIYVLRTCGHVTSETVLAWQLTEVYLQAYSNSTHTHLLQVSSALSDKMSVVPFEDFNLKTIVVVHLEMEKGEG